MNLFFTPVGRLASSVCRGFSHHFIEDFIPGLIVKISTIFLWLPSNQALGPPQKWRKVPHIGIAPDFPRFWCVFLFAIHSWVPQIWSPRWVCLNTLGPASDSQWLIIIFSPQEALFWMPPVDETSPFHSRHFWFQVTSNKGG